MPFSEIDQEFMMSEIKNNIAFLNGLVPIDVEFKKATEPVIFGDGTYEAGKPCCVVTGKTIDIHGIAHGTRLVINGQDWFVIGVNLTESGLYDLEVSKTK